MMKSVLAVCFAIVALAQEHPCEEEVATACPDRPGEEIAACLKKPSEHDTEISLSSECTDFVALNSACKEDIKAHCDDNFFTPDTTLCLTQWVDKENLSPKCASVLEWAVPKEEASEEEGDGPTDELGMSQKDYEEKEEWRAKRKAVREQAIERMKMKEVDRKNEEDRVALETFKKENPEAYAEMIQQQEEEKKQQAEFKRQERMRAAALERKKQQEAGEEEDEAPKQQKEKQSGKKKSKGSWLNTIIAAGIVAAVGYAIYFFATSTGGPRKTNGAGSGKKGKKSR